MRRFGKRFEKFELCRSQGDERAVKSDFVPFKIDTNRAGDEVFRRAAFAGRRAGESSAPAPLTHAG